MRAKVQHSRLVFWLFALCILINGAPILGGQPAGGAMPDKASDARAPASTVNAAGPRQALVFFSQHRLPESAWAALFAAVRASLPEAAQEVPALDAHAMLIRGDALPRQDSAQQAVIVYLHGDCIPFPLREPFSTGERLGWVVKADGRIQPVIHVECTAIGAELSVKTERMDGDARTAAMSGAMARVILHEWAHIALQTDAHGARGITQPRFGVEDLLSAGSEAQDPARGGR